MVSKMKIERSSRSCYEKRCVSSLLFSSSSPTSPASNHYVTKLRAPPFFKILLCYDSDSWRETRKAGQRQGHAAEDPGWNWTPAAAVRTQPRYMGCALPGSSFKLRCEPHVCCDRTVPENTQRRINWDRRRRMKQGFVGNWNDWAQSELESGLIMRPDYRFNAYKYVYTNNTYTYTHMLHQSVDELSPGTLLFVFCFLFV